MAEKFHIRFNIGINLEEAKRLFVNRVQNELLSEKAYWTKNVAWSKAGRAIAIHMGEPENYNINLDNTFECYTLRNFERTLQVLEGLFALFSDGGITQRINKILDMSEVDLGIRWSDGVFLPSGAEELDESLVNDSLKWLRDQKYETVLVPFQKALDHLLRARSKPELLSDVITDAFEALEALAKIVTGRENKTLDVNCELFLSKIGASEAYKPILRKYIIYAHNFRHGASNSSPKPIINYAETESFVYLTGLFIRLVISSGFAPTPEV